MNWVGALTVFLMVLSIVFAYSRFTEYETEVQRDLYNSLVGKTYPRFGEESGDGKYNFQVINVDVDRSSINSWEKVSILEFDMSEFPWEGSDIEDWDSGVSVLKSASERDDIETIEEFMEQELVDLCSINRKMGPEFEPMFTDSAYGPILSLKFESKDLFLLTEQLEMVADTIPLLFATWIQSLMGFNTRTTLLGMVHTAIAHSEEMEYDEDAEQYGES